jgi:hypothetical protein
MAWLTLLAPILLELLKIFFSKTDVEVKQQAQKDILEKLRQIRAAMAKAEETEGDTSDLEDIVNRPK